MNRIVSTILILVLLGLTFHGLDALKAESSSNNGQKRMVKRRSKRDMPLMLPTTSMEGPCNYGGFTNCDQYAAHTTQIGLQLQKSISYVQGHNYFLGGLVSLPALQNGGMCVPNTNLFTADGFSALSMGHLTVPQLSTLSLLPVSSVSLSSLLSASYVSQMGQWNVLTPLGLQASIFGHILPSQLQPLSLYPLQTDMMSSNFLQQAGYLQSDCVPTALGLAASYIRYIPNNFASSFCEVNNDYPMSIDRLMSAKYVYGSSRLITSIGMVAMQSGYITQDIFRNLGCFPFAFGGQTQTTEYVYQEQQINSIFGDLVHTGYVYQNKLLTNVGYYAIAKSYFTIDHFRRLNLWPCSITPTMDTFVAAGYAAYSGHLTSLGYSLLMARYFSYEMIVKLGIVLNHDFNIYHHALNFGGYISSTYHEAHVAVHSAATYPSYGGVQAAQVSQYQASSGAAVASSAFAPDASFGINHGFGLPGASFANPGFAGDSAFVKK